MIPDQSEDDMEVRSSINLLNTIKLPKNLQSLREQLPKSKYQEEQKEESSRYGHVSQQRLKEIVKRKQ